MRKIIFIIIISFFSRSSCYTQELILSPKNKTIYVLIEKDTAYIEYFIVDKPNRYYKFDTLYKNEDAAFRGAKSHINIANDNYFLYVNNDSFAEKSFRLYKLSSKQTRKRNVRHNSMLYNSNIVNVNQIRQQYIKLKNNESLKAMEEEWDQLFYARDKLDIDTFRKKMKVFLNKYDIKMIYY